MSDDPHARAAAHASGAGKGTHPTGVHTPPPALPVNDVGETPALPDRAAPGYNREFDDERLAALYDVFYSPRLSRDFEFYLPLIMQAPAVLDVGCGTGALLRLAREAGHTGRLCGLDPSAAMLAQARTRADIEWVQGDLSTAAWEGEFDLVTMTGHAFQELHTDAEIGAALAAMRRALRAGGRVAFETRNPLRRDWENWGAQYSLEAREPGGAVVRVVSEPGRELGGGLVYGAGVYSSPAWPEPVSSHGVLRFVERAALAALLAGAGLVIERQYGDWDGAPLTDASPEIITIARPG